MFTKHVSELTYTDIYDLINVQKIGEGYGLDFKREIGNLEKAKKEFSKDVSAFANSSGGYLMLGVDNDGKIIGVDNSINSKPVVEWINQVLSSNVEPSLFYFDPKIIPIPDSEKILVVIHIPESIKKPHIVTELNTYFIRVNDSKKSANHYQIRDMFEFSKNRTNEFNDFLKKRNLLDEDDSEFALTKNSKRLDSPLTPKPMVIFSLIPEYINEVKIKMPVGEYKQWLEDNSKGYTPFPSMALFYMLSDCEHRIDGLVMKRSRHNSSGMNSYFEVVDNGYVEAGFSHTISHEYTDSGGKLQIAFYLTNVIGYEMLLLGFAKKFYELAEYSNEVVLQISFVNVLNFKLFGLHDQYSNTLRYSGDTFTNKQHNNFKLVHRFNPKNVTEESILAVAKSHSEKICRVFGLSQDLCFVNDNISRQQYQNNFAL